MTHTPEGGGLRPPPGKPPLSDLESRAVDAVREKFPDAWMGMGEHAGQKWVFVMRDQVIAVLRMLRDDLGYDLLMDLTCVDWLDKGMPERFCVVYQLYSTTSNAWFRLKCWVPESDPEVDSASELWKAAPWAEREVWDMYGLRFRGHRDLRRILMPFDYQGHPLRKDYPLVGMGERQTFPKYTK